MLINMKCGSTWGEMANGGGVSTADTNIKRKIQLLGQIGVPVILTWHHEPENDSCGETPFYGTPDEYRKAYRHFASHVRANGGGKVATGLILMGWTFDLSNTTVFTTCTGVTASNGPLRNPENWWPGDDAVDWVLADPYAEGSGVTFSNIVTGFVNWSNRPCPANHPTTDYNCTAARASKPLGLAEYSVNGEHSVTYRASWLDDHKLKMRNYLKLKLYAFWSDQSNSTALPWWADYPTTDPDRQVLKAFTRLSNDSWFTPGF
jgi:hypothetical protein